MMRKKITNKEKFQFREEEVLSPIPMVGRNSVQSRLARKSDNKLAYNQNQSGTGLFGRPDAFRRANNNQGGSRNDKKGGDIRHVLQPDDSRHSVKEGGVPPTLTKHQAGSRDPVLDEIVAKLKSGLQLSSNNIQIQATPPSNVTVHQKPVFNIPRSSVKQETDVAKKMPQKTFPPASLQPPVADGCICFRPLKLVMCEVCGETFRARVSLVCTTHPRALYLQDVKECKGCKQTNKQALKEYDLPPGMEKGIKNVMDRKSRWIGIN